MNLFCARLGAVGGLTAILVGCSGEAASPAGDLSELSVVEVTTVTTVQGASGVFLSPRPQQLRPSYVQSTSAARAPSGTPSLAEERAKVDSALLFRSSRADRFSLDAAVPSVAPQHFYPLVDGERWPIELSGRRTEGSVDLWSEFDGFRSYPGLMLGDAAAATLDYEQVGLRAPLVLRISDESAADVPLENQTLIVTNRSDREIARALLVYSHEGGIGLREVGSVAPGRGEVTATGPKERPPNELLDEARGALEAFFSAELGPELGAALARAKSVPFLETRGLRLIYLMNEAAAPAAIGLPEAITLRRRVCVGQAEVLSPAEEARVTGLLDTAHMTTAELVTELGRFARAKLEAVTSSRNVDARARAERLLVELAE